MSQFENSSDYIEKTLKTYGDLEGDLHLVELQKDGAAGLGLSLAGNKDLTTMSIYVVDIQPGSPADICRQIQIGDELLEINGQALYGRSHLNASPIVKAITCSRVKILLLRTKDSFEHMAKSQFRQSTFVYGDNLSKTTLILKKPTTSVSLDPNEDPVEALDINKAQCCSSETNGDAFIENGVFSSHSSSEQPDQVEQVHPHITKYSSPTLPSHSSNNQQIGIKSKRSLQKCTNVEEHDDAGVLSNSSRSNLAAGDIFPVQIERNQYHRASKDEISPESSSDSSLLNPLCEDPCTCSIIPGRPTHIDIRKGKTGLGLKIIGGSDTMLKGVFVYELYKDGAAAKDGRLQPGDQILEANGKDLRDSSYCHSVQVLRQVASTVKLVIFREESIFSNEDLFEVLAVDLLKRPGKGLGISISPWRDGVGAFVSDIVKGTAADADGLLLPGDQILSINGEDIRQMAHECVAQLLKTLVGKISVTVNRLKIGPKTSISSRTGSTFSRYSSDKGLKKSELVTSNMKNSRKGTVTGCHGIPTCLKSAD